MTGFWRNRDGASIVEFALLIGPFMLVLFGVVEISRALWTRQALQDIATATARCVGVLQAECADDDGFSRARTETFIAGAANGRAVRMDAGATDIGRGVACDGLSDAVAVSLRAHFDSVFPFAQALDFHVRACFLDWSAI